MRSQHKKFRRPLTRIARVALVVSCAAGIVVLIKWIPTSVGGPTAIVALTELPSGVEHRMDVKTVPPATRSSKARCPDCGVIESAREVTKTNETTGAEQCADRGTSSAVTTESNESEENADLAILLDWHMNARNGYSFIRGEIGCATVAALAAPLLIEPSKAYEILVRFRDGSSQVLTEASLSTWRRGERKGSIGSD